MVRTIVDKVIVGMLERNSRITKEKKKWNEKIHRFFNEQMEAHKAAFVCFLFDLFLVGLL